MIIIWRRWGIMVFVLVVGLSLAANLIANRVTGSRQYWDEHGWPLAASLMASGVACWLLGLFLEQRLDSESEQNLAARDAFFFISVRWWGPILVGIALVVLITGFAPGHA
jgi:hypothetical protein